jgi:hypothetical protein
MIATIRNCSSSTCRECPRLWDRLIPADSPATRRCGSCNRSVYLCSTDEETAAHAKAGHVIAREAPTDAELGTKYREIASGILLPLAWGDPTPEQAAARDRRLREFAIDAAIGAVRYASRDCPRCRYPVADYRVTCHVCGMAIGRVYDK